MGALVIKDKAAIQMLMLDYLVEAGIEVRDTAFHLDDAMRRASTPDLNVVVL